MAHQFKTLEDGCPLAEEVYSSLAYHIAQWAILASCTSSIVVVSYSIARYLRRWSETITKELVFVLYLYVIIYDAGQIFNQVIILYYRYSAPTPCKTQIPRGFCVARLLGSSVVPSFVILNIAITVQRALSTFGFCALTEKIASRALIGVSVLYAVGYGIYTYIPEPLDGYATYCSSITMFSGVRVVVNIYVMFALDVVNVMVVFGLWKYNKRQLETKPNYHLGKKFNRLMNVNILSKNMTVQILHTVVYLCLFIAYVLVGTFLKHLNADKDFFVINVVINIFPLYVLVFPAVLTILIRKEEQQKKSRVKSLIKMGNQSTNDYFKSLSKAWGSSEVGQTTEKVHEI